MRWWTNEAGRHFVLDQEPSGKKQRKKTAGEKDGKPMEALFSASDFAAGKQGRVEERLLDDIDSELRRGGSATPKARRWRSRWRDVRPPGKALASGGLRRPQKISDGL